MEFYIHTNFVFSVSWFSFYLRVYFVCVISYKIFLYNFHFLYLHSVPVFYINTNVDVQSAYENDFTLSMLLYI